MMFLRSTLVSVLLLSGTAAAFNVSPGNAKRVARKADVPDPVRWLAAGAVAAAIVLQPAPAEAASLVKGTPLEGVLSDFGAASYPVFNSIQNVSPLADKFLDILDRLKTSEAADAVDRGVDAVLSIPDIKVEKYSYALKAVYQGVGDANCVELGGSGRAANALANSPYLRLVPDAKVKAIQRKFKPANSSVPKKNGNICLPPSAAASSRLWVAQGELTFDNIGKAEAANLVKSLDQSAVAITRSVLTQGVSTAKEVFGENPESKAMEAAGKAAESEIISSVRAVLK